MLPGGTDKRIIEWEKRLAAIDAMMPGNRYGGLPVTASLS
jgi:hypothetical protein